MADVETTAAPAASPVAAAPKKGKGAAKPKSPKKVAGAAKPRGPAKAATHPPANTMVVEAVGALAEKGGSSLQAIKKHIAAFYKVDAEKLAPFIRKALKKQVEAGKLTQTKGTGASGSFKLTVKPKPVKAKKPAGEKKTKVAKPKSPKKAAAKKPKKAGSPKAKKPASPKKAAAPKAKKAAPASPKKAVAPKPAAEKKAKKAVKPKTPKVKLPKTLKAKSPAKPKTAAKKAAPKPKKQ